MLSEKLVEAMSKQINEEMFSSNLYLAMAIDCETRGLSGFASWLKVQSREEMDHAYTFIDYVLKRGSKPIVMPIAEVKTSFGEPLELFEEVLKHEQYITKSIDELVDVASKERDKATQDFLWGFVREQVEEESNVSAILDRIKLAGKQNIVFVDHELSTREQ